MTRTFGACALLAFVAVAGAACTANIPTPTIRERADRLFDQGEFEKAAADYQEVTFRYPGDAEAHYRLGLCLLEQGQPAEARRPLEIALAQQPLADDIADALARALFEQGDEAQLVGFLRGRAEERQTVRAHLELARYSLELNDPDLARLAINTAMRLDGGKTAEPYIAAAALAERVGDTDEAVRRLRQAYGVNPDHPIVQERLRALGEVPGPTLALPPTEG
jgi:tetratricopeptide (TPR) repeat protein